MCIRDRYWITYDESPVYKSLMVDLQKVMEHPGTEDVKVESVFTQSMFRELRTAMSSLEWEGLDQVEDRWKDFKERTIISGFLKDGELGKKRLASMPDRMTNTIGLADGSLAFRPTIINCYNGDLSTQEGWFHQWKDFMFNVPVSYTHLRAHETVLDLVCRLLLEKKKINIYNRSIIRRSE
eukprot:TRINITY_DN30086_c0_g1_i1.p1 TRINITY_DN30086_c0_g1~~TRINITY_DN30086_c0_g1_i1.p1  ORF type:complete len:181 (-),score=66.89 TRINITY_DN30086_c0_g1_i1:74-616(-)